jgi:hypothetical protein
MAERLLKHGKKQMTAPIRTGLFHERNRYNSYWKDPAATSRRRIKLNTTIKGQNDDEPVSFILTDRNETQLVFENRKHNYPQKISYTQISKDSLTEISGMQSGKLSSEKYIMLRTK